MSFLYSFSLVVSCLNLIAMVAGLYVDSLKPFYIIDYELLVNRLTHWNKGDVFGYPTVVLKWTKADYLYHIKCSAGLFQYSGVMTSYFILIDCWQASGRN